MSLRFKCLNNPPGIQDHSISNESDCTWVGLSSMTPGLNMDTLCHEHRKCYCALKLTNWTTCQITWAVSLAIANVQFTLSTGTWYMYIYLTPTYHEGVYSQVWLYIYVWTIAHLLEINDSFQYLSNCYLSPIQQLLCVFPNSFHAWLKWNTHSAWCLSQLAQYYWPWGCLICAGLMICFTTGCTHQLCSHSVVIDFNYSFHTCA